MKNRSKELDVDFIGGQEPMTKDEERALSEYFKAQKVARAKKRQQTVKSLRKRKVSA